MYSQNFTVRFCETDALKHVNNTVVAAWFETAREPIFRLFTPELDLDNWPLIIASYKIDFLRQIHYGSEVEVRTYVQRIGRSSFETYQEVWQNEQVCASGSTTLVHFDYRTNSSVPIEGKLRENMEAHLREDPS